jgi:predicted kinase
MPLFMAIRACIRSHVTAAQAQLASGASRNELESEARICATLAGHFLAPASKSLLVIGGLSGTGKSTVAAAIADQLGPVPGARVLESDRIRKRLYGARAETRLPVQAYRPDVSERVYAALAREARAVLNTGHSVVVDAVFEHSVYRDWIERTARDANVPFIGIWLHASPQTLFARVSARRGDASDATVEVVRHQIETQNAPANWIWINANEIVGEIVARIVKAFETHCGGQQVFNRGAV